MGPGQRVEWLQTRCHQQDEKGSGGREPVGSWRRRRSGGRHVVPWGLSCWMGPVVGWLAPHL